MNFSLQGLLKLLLDPRFVTLVVVSLLGIALIAWVGNALIPFGAAAVLTYFLDGGISRLMRWKLGRAWAFTIVFFVFLVCYFALFLGPVRLAVRQGLTMAADFPRIEAMLERAVVQLPETPLSFLPPEQRREVMERMLPTLAHWGAMVLERGLRGMPDIPDWVGYALIVPFLVFFFLKDKGRLLEGWVKLLPKDRELIDKIFQDVEDKTARYVRGTLWRILIVGTVTWIGFLALGFKYAAILGLLTGLSVVVPYLGALAVAIPLAILGFDQWGASLPLGWLVVVYAAIQSLDGYVLAPLLLSITVKLHPVTTLVAVLVFGSLWGFWGLVFAIPLATLVKSFLLTVIEHQDKLV